MKTKIIADSTCDLSRELMDKYNIRTIPLGIIMGDKTYKDAVDINQDDIFKYAEAGNGTCHTVAINVDEFMQAFNEELENCDAIICITISSEMSACFQNACIAAAEFENVFTVDSRNLSTGVGHIVLDAAIMAEQGMQPHEIKEKLDARTSKVEASFIINTLKYLYKGGRCTALTALGANLLQLKPCIEVTEGKMSVGKKYRGNNIEKIYKQYISDRLNDRSDIDYKRIFITHTVPDRELVERIREYIESLGLFSEIIETKAGCTVSNHCGPYTLGILFYRK